MKLAEWARRNGIHPQTAYRWFREGTMPVPARKLDSGTIIVESPATATDGGRVAVYARVSSADQRADLDRQVGRLAAYATTAGLSVSVTVAEVGSGLHGERPKLRRLLADPTVTTIVVEHRERLARFGVPLIEAALAAQGRRILVVDPTTGVDDDLVRDLTDVLTWWCARLYSRRSARTRAARAVRAAAQPVE